MSDDFGPNSEDARSRTTVSLPVEKLERSALEAPSQGGQTREGEGSVDEGDDLVLEAGTVVGHFRVIRMLGQGGMGVVYLARDLRLGRKVALKLVHNDLLESSDEILQQFLLEARMTAKFNHPNIVTIYAVGQFGHAPYVALEYLEGQNLRERMQERRLSLAESLRICLAVAQGVEEAHRHGVLHRDLKPANVLIPSDGRVRVVDFGLAHELVDKRQSAEMLDGADERRESSARGTPDYMAPEQWMNYDLGPTVDVWAIGLILFELCAERLPYEERKMIRLFHAVTDDGPMPRLSAFAEVPVAVDELVARCLAKKPEQRPDASHVVESLREILLDSQQTATEEESPFRGLLAFAERHASLFFGRDAEVASLVERLRQEPVVAVVGPSGVGKSSFVQAGVVPRLREQGRWLVVRMRPGDKPLRRLATRLLAAKEGETGSHSIGGSGELQIHRESQDEAAKARLTSSQRRTTGANEILHLEAQMANVPGQLALELHHVAIARQGQVLLFIDQMEEVFTLCEDEEKAAAFVRAVCAAADDASEPVRVVFTVRDDFLGRLAQVGSGVREVLRHVMVLHSPDKETLVETLTAPLLSRGYRFDDPTLPVRMVESVDAKACLPLLQFAARRLWDQRDRGKRLLRDQDYEKMGGVVGALIQHADSLLQGMSVSEMRLARDLLLRMVTPEKTRRIVAKQALLDGLPADAAAVLDRLTQSRLITVTKSGRDVDAEAQLELAHESLVHSWALLSTWLDEGRDEHVFLAEAGQAAALWDKRGRRDVELWDELALRDAKRRTEENDIELPSLVQEFFERGRRAHARSVQRRRGLFGLLLVGFASAAVVFAIQKMQADEQRDVASYQWQRAEQQRKVASRQRAEALFESGRGAYDRGDLVEARAKLRAAIEGGVSSPSARRLWYELQRDPRRWSEEMAGALYDVAIAANGSQIAVACQDGLAYVFDAKTKAMRVMRGGDGQVLSVAFSVDAKHLATAGTSSVVHVWEVASGKEIRRLKRHKSLVRKVQFSDDGRYLVSVSDDQTIVWSAQSGELLRSLKSPENVRDVDISADGTKLVVAGSGYRLYSLGSGKLLREKRGGRLLRSVRFSQDGAMLALGGDAVAAVEPKVDAGPGVIVLESETGERLTEFARGRKVHALRFSRNGRRLYTSDDEAAVRVWRSRDGRLEKLIGQPSRRAEASKKRCGSWRCATAVLGLDLGPKGRWLATAGADHRVRVWDTSKAMARSDQQGAGGAIYAVAFHPKKPIIAAGSLASEGAVRLWSVAEARALTVLPSPAAEALVFHPKGELVTGGGDGHLRIWNDGGGRLVRQFKAHGSTITDVAIAPVDGRLLATASNDRTIALWDYETGAPLQKKELGVSVRRIVFNDSGTQLAASTDDGTVWLFDVPGFHLRWKEPLHKQVIYGLRFYNEDTKLVSGGSEGVLKNTDVLSHVSETLNAKLGRVNGIDLDRTNNKLLIALGDSTSRLFDSRIQSYQSFIGHSGEVNTVAFAPDGKLAVSGGDDETVRVWNTATSRPHWWSAGMTGSAPVLWTRLGAIDMVGDSMRLRRPAVEKGSWRAEMLNEARLSGVDASNRYLCTYSFAGDLKGWRLADNRRLFQSSLPGVDEVRATKHGCLVRTGERVSLIDYGGSAKPLALRVGPRTEKAVGIGDSTRGILLAGESQVQVLSSAGKVVDRLLVGRGVTAVAAVSKTEGDRFFIGYRDGNVEIRTGTSGPALSIQRRASGEVVRLLPIGTSMLAVGYASGAVGLWNTKDGGRLRMTQLHGQARHMRFAGGKLYVATDLGSPLRWNLSHMFSSDCDLLRAVWREVGVSWNGGVRGVAVPQQHRCRDTSRQAAAK